MGIPSYFSYVIKNHRNIVKRLRGSNINFHNLYMDCNSIVYDVVHSLDSIDENTDDIIIKMVLEKIDKYIFTVRPSNTIFIAFDGVAPFAKMEQQRTRRFKSWFMNKALNQNDKWNTAKITPGTEFMKKLTEKLKIHFEYQQTKYGVKNLLLSSSNEAGEGEHKLYSHMRKNADIKSNTIVYGLDSDLIMLSIFHRELFQNIYIFREAPEFLKSSIPIVYEEKNEPFLLDIDYLIRSILAEMNCKNFDNHRIYDYVFLCFFLGNDFLPHFPALNIRTHGITILLEIYRMFIGNLPEVFFISRNKEIKWGVVHNFITHIAKNEHQLLIEEYFVREKWDSKKWNKDVEMEELLLNAPVIYREVEKYICPYEKFWQERYYKILLDSPRDEVFLRDICNNYLEGLEWVLKYYLFDCPDWRWKYNYHYPPLFTDLLLYIPRLPTNFINEKRPPVKNNTQLAYVFSYHQLSLLDEKTQNILKQKYSHFYPETIKFKWSFCRYFWESHTCLPEIPINVIDEWEQQL